MSDAASEAPPASSLPVYDGLTVARARQLAAVSGAAAVRDYTGEADSAMAYAAALAEAQHLLAELAAIIDRLDAAHA